MSLSRFGPFGYAAVVALLCAALIYAAGMAYDAASQSPPMYCDGFGNCFYTSSVPR